MLQRIRAIIQKDIILRFSSRSELVFFLILPIVFTALLGGGVAFGSPEGDNRLLLPVVDLDRSNASAALIAELRLSDMVRIEPMNEAEAESMLAERDASAALIIPDGYSASLEPEKLLAGEQASLVIRSAPDSNVGLTAEQAVRGAAAAISWPLLVARASITSLKSIAPFNDDAQRAAFFDRSQEAAEAIELPARVIFEMANKVAAYDQRAQSSAGQLITWVLIPLLGISGLFAFERVSGTLRRTIITPTRRTTYLLGTIGGQLLLAMVQMALLVAFGIFVMHVPWGRDPAALALILVTFGLASVALGTLLGTVTKTESQASNLSIMLGMTMALLGGCWWPQELFPPALQTVTKVLPTTWAMQAMTDITMRGRGLPDVTDEAAVLVGFAFLFFVIAVWRFRYE